MRWEPTDQFGNFFIGTSEATTEDEFRAELASLLDELVERAGRSFTVTVDLEYDEVNGPDPESVSHALRGGWIEAQKSDPDFSEAIVAALARLCQEKGLSEVTISKA